MMKTEEAIRRLIKEEEELVASLAESKYKLPYIDHTKSALIMKRPAIPEKDAMEMNVAPFFW